MLSRIFSLFRGKVGKAAFASSTLPNNDEEEGTGVLATHNADGLVPAEQQAFWKMASEHSQIPIFNGHIEHGYAVAPAADPGRCPRCGGATERKYAHFIYTTQLALRAMFAPAGHFCTRCPSVTIEENMIEAGIVDRRFHYERVIGIDYGGKKAPDYFRTWKGEDLVYVLDEDERLVGVTTRSRLEPGHAPPVAAAMANKQAKKKRGKIAKRSQRRNRKK